MVVPSAAQLQAFAGGQMTDLPEKTGAYDPTALIEIVSPGNAEEGINYSMPIGTLLGYPFDISITLPGPATGIYPGCSIDVTDNAVVTPTYYDEHGNYTPEGWGNVCTLNCNWTSGDQGTATGARTSFLGNLFFTHPSSPANNARWYSAGILTANIYVDDGGTLGNHKGVAYGLATVTYLKNDVKHWGSVFGYESDMVVEAGANVNYKIGIASYLSVNDAVQGNIVDAAFYVTAQNGTVGWRHGYLVHNQDGGQPFSADGTMIGTLGAVTMATAVDVSSATVTGHLLKSSRLNITGQGAYQLVSGALTGDIPAVSLQSGSAAIHIYDVMGRNIVVDGGDFYRGVAAAPNDFMTGTVAGDCVIAYRRDLYLGWLGSAPDVKISSTGVVSILNLTASSSLATNANKELVSVANTGTGTNVLASAVTGHLNGLTLSTAGASATFGIEAGGAANSTGADVMALASAYTKTTSAWAVGTAAGSLDTGAIANSTWYHVFLIKRPDTGVVDILISLSPTAPTLPANYTLFRRIGSMRTNGSAQWTKFFQDGDTFIWDVPIADVTSVNPTTSAVLRTLTIPLGINTFPIFHGRASTLTAASACAVLFTDPQQTDTVPDFVNSQAIGNATLAPFANLSNVRSNTSSQVRSRCSFSDALVTLTMVTDGWKDRRGA